MTDNSAQPSEAVVPTTSTQKHEKKGPRKEFPSDVAILPFHSNTQALFSNIVHTTVKVPLSVTLTELSNKAHMVDLVHRTLLFRSLAQVTSVGAKRREREEDDDSDDEAVKRQAPRSLVKEMIVRISKIGAASNHTQYKGIGVVMVKFVLPVDVVVATVSMGICPGILREQPTPDSFIVEVASGDERVMVTCACTEQEPAVIGQTVIVAAEPSCIRVQVFRVSRVSRGKFQKNIDVKLGTTEIKFVPDVFGDAQDRKAAEERPVVTSQ